MTTDEVVEEIAGALVDADPWLGSIAGPLSSDDYRNLARTALRKIQELRLTAVLSDC